MPDVAKRPFEKPAFNKLRERGWVRDAAVRGLHRVGWASAAHLPEPLTRLAVEQLSRLAVRLDLAQLATLRENLERTTGQPPSAALLQQAVASYLRNFVEVLALPGWTRSSIARRVRVTNDRALRQAFDTTGAIVALPHSGNWDLAGAWACVMGMPVTTVAEQLNPAEFAAYLRFREGLGMEVLSHRNPSVLPNLFEAVRRRRLVCLLADRDLGGTGIEVRWGSENVRMPGGPALVARRTGATLFAGVCRYTSDGMVIVLGEPIEHRPGREGLQAMTQDIAKHFVNQIREQPADWHMMQPFFDLPAGRR